MVCFVNKMKRFVEQNKSECLFCTFAMYFDIIARKNKCRKRYQDIIFMLYVYGGIYARYKKYL